MLDSKEYSEPNLNINFFRLLEEMMDPEVKKTSRCQQSPIPAQPKKRGKIEFSFSDFCVTIVGYGVLHVLSWVKFSCLSSY